MRSVKLNLCSLGDPTDPETWSGTPFNLYSELLRMNCLGSAFSSTESFNKYELILIELINKVYYSGSVDLNRGFLHRYLKAKKVKKMTQKSISNFTLHTGALDLPFFKYPKNQKHYLYCDSSWNLWTSYSTSMTGYSKKLLKDAEKLDTKAYHQVEHIFSVSEYVKENLIAHYNVNPTKITVVGTGLGVIKPYYGEKNYSNGKILFVAKGRFEDKGGPLVLKAFQIALKSYPHLHLIIVGQDAYKVNINLPNVKTYGFLSKEKLQELFNESSLFLMPSINEPWGLVYLEALACRMPIVGLNRNSFPEINKNGVLGYGLNEMDPERIAEILIDAFSTPQKLSETGLKAQKYCLDKFSWNKTVTKIIKTIENTC